MPKFRLVSTHPFLFILLALIVFYGLFSPLQVSEAGARTITDFMGRTHDLPENIDRVICSGSGCLRLLTYLQAQDRIVGVDSAEKNGLPFSLDARPYAIANPQFKDYPLFGEFRGHDSPELIAGLDPQPQVIFKTYATRDGGVDILQEKTGIPVIALGYGNLTYRRDELNRTLRIMGRVLDQEERAGEIIAYFDALEQDLKTRTMDLPEDKRPSVYVGGVAQRGGHGFQATEPTYAPLKFLQARNVAAELTSPEKRVDHATVSKEKILIWDPDIIFVDLSTSRLEGMANGLEQLRNDPTYSMLKAVRGSQVYGLFPYKFYTQNFDNIFANAYFMGKVIYPERFQDIDPLQKAEQISEFLNGGPAFEIMNKYFDGLAFSRIKMN